MVRVQMPTNSISMEGNEQDVVQLLRDQLKARIQNAAADWLLKNEHAIFYQYLRLAQWSVIIMVYLQEPFIYDLRGV